MGLGFVERDRPGGELDRIAVYDPEGALLYSVFYTEPDELPDSPFTSIDSPVERYTFVGFKTDNGDRIGRVVLQGHVREEGPFHLIGLQDLQFVPEPGAGAQVFAALATLCALRRARRSLS